MRNVLGFKINKQFAFTLAEVLITLGIIGVVAALTIPNLIQNSQKEEYVGKVKKTYTTLEQAIKLSEIDNGPWQQWNYGTINDGNEAVKFANTYLIPYMSVAKNCETNTGCWVTEPKKFNGTEASYGDGTEYAKFVLSDGTAIHVAIPVVGQSYLHFDINGLNGPNIYGKDILTYYMIPGSRLGTGSLILWSDADFIGTDQNACTKTAAQPDACLTKIIRDGWQIKSDYPW